MAQSQLRMDRLDWRGKVALVAAIALGVAAVVALIVVSLGLAIVLLPLVALAVVIGRWRLNRLVAEARKARTTRPETARTIEISDYSVIAGERRR